MAAPLYEAYADSAAIEKAEALFSRAAGEGLEAMGLLSGRVCSWKGSKYILVEDFVTARNSASAVSVKFSGDAFAELASNAQRQKGRMFVGWAHSHPGYGCFLSGTDVDTQRKYFPEPFHVALVVDPLKRGTGGALKMFYKLHESGYREASFAVVKGVRYG